MPKCPQCEKHFDRTRKYPVQRYCSRHCGNAYRVHAFRQKQKDAKKG